MMTFEEIGADLGISAARAGQIYQVAMRKLRARPAALARLHGLADLLERERALRVPSTEFAQEVWHESKTIKKEETCAHFSDSR